MHAALVVANRVNLIDYQVTHVAKHFAALPRGEQEKKRLGGGDQNVWRPSEHGLALVRGRVAGAHQRMNGGRREIHHKRRLLDAVQRLLQIAMNVVIERFERRDVKRVNAAGIAAELFRICLHTAAKEIINTPQKGGKGFARAGGRENQGVLAGSNHRPALRLRRTRRREVVAEPFFNNRVKGDRCEHGVLLVCEIANKELPFGRFAFAAI